MIKEHLKLLCEQFGLGSLQNHATRIYGGLLHIMWRLDTDKGSYAIKQLSKYIRACPHFQVDEKLSELF